MTVLLESRIEELVADGNRRDAAELATAALKNDDLVDVSVSGDTVVVETRRFRGVHDVRRGGDEPSVVQQGEYEVKGDLSFTFSTATMRDDALDAARTELRSPDDRGVDADPDDDGSATVDAAAATDGGEPANDHEGAFARFAALVRSLVG